MYTAIYTFVRAEEQPPKPWVFLNPNYSSVFTQTEIDTVVEPYRNYLRSLEGWNPAVVEEVNPTTLRFTWTTTSSNFLIAINDVFKTADQSSPAYQAGQLLAQKRSELGISYTVTKSVTRTD